MNNKKINEMTKEQLIFELEKKERQLKAYNSIMEEWAWTVDLSYFEILTETEIDLEDWLDLRIVWEQIYDNVIVIDQKQIEEWTMEWKEVKEVKGKDED